MIDSTDWKDCRTSASLRRENVLSWESGPERAEA